MKDDVVEARSLVKRFKDMIAVDGVSFSIKRGEVLSIIGPSGCGKTTTLRIIAGLETVDEGEVYIDGNLVTSEKVFVPPEKRDLGLVFQSYALWPHMTVYENVAYGLKVRKFPKEEIDRKVKSYLEILGLSGLENRYPSQLSGGQQQRVALARSLAYEPKVLLLDEPLSNLDFRVRDRMRVELRNLLKELNITSLYVTHDQEEAFVIADRIMVMNEGKVVQTGTPEEIYERPANTFVANFVGRANMFKAKAEVSDERGVVKIENSDIVLCCRTDLDKFNSCYVIIRPNEIGIFDSRPDFDENVFEGEILERTYRGPVTDHVVSLGNMEIMVTTHKHCRSTSPIERKRVFLHIPPDAITVIPSD